MTRFLMTILLALLIFSSAAWAERTTISPETSVIGQLRALPAERALRLESVRLHGQEQALDLELQPFTVYADGARISVHQADGTTRTEPMPNSRWYAGVIAGQHQSRVMIALHETSGLRGLVFLPDGELHLLAAGSAARSPEDSGLVTRRIDVEAELAGREFTCGNAELTAPLSFVDNQPARPRATDLIARLAAPAQPAGSGQPTYWNRLAIETDTEYLALFGGNTTAATEYAADLIAFTSLRYQDEVDTGLALIHISLWETPDPWTQSSSICLMMEYGRYWNQNNTGIDRTATHYLSGKPTGGGVAWLGVLCSGPFTVNLQNFGLNCPGLPSIDSYGGAHGFSGSINGNFNINNPGLVGDLFVFAHEIGHNFNSEHTHCYAGIAGNPIPVDECSNVECNVGCYCGSPSLPDGQPPGSQAGTLMSYCHLLAGGINNIAWSFGTGHPFGVLPQRVPDRMFNHVVTRSNQNPGCLDVNPAPEIIFIDGFESGP